MSAAHRLKDTTSSTGRRKSRASRRVGGVFAAKTPKILSLCRLALQKGVVMAKVSRQVIVISMVVLIAPAGTKSAHGK